MTEDLATVIAGVSRVLVRVPGHTETDETEKFTRRVLHPVEVIATSRAGLLTSRGIHANIVDLTVASVSSDK